MNKKENYEVFHIKCLNSNHQEIDASVRIWTGTEINPTVYQFPTYEPYTYKGKAAMYYLEYKNEEDNVIQTKSDRINDAFYDLCSKLDKLHIKMLIKGCSYGYYMIPRLHYSIYAVKLILGKRLDKNYPRVNIFSEESDLENIRNVKQLNEYYNEWIKSISVIPY
ncbi:hypothetical protein GNY06_06120 [Elizabethkingia argentiflava]|uniref:Uncharacterized protein n=1 Tax=Elizabethkingia argenteiflava TaxID=2681556 RepID=A0A845PTK3_9FLAO|nr:hypothetical protein [Elizabethkingia argenteiflava]NAW50965.1 hypothetical protein [Elizabethkingia argenteiflava]